MPPLFHATARSAACTSRCALIALRFDISDAVITPKVTIPIMMVDNALISGETPRRTALQILIGRVVEDGPVVN